MKLPAIRRKALPKDALVSEDPYNPPMQPARKPRSPVDVPAAMQNLTPAAALRIRKKAKSLLGG
jgi:hypothetical protein